jgi:hypothetical protein
MHGTALFRGIQVVCRRRTEEKIEDEDEHA